MEVCPECKRVTLCYDPRIQRARCTVISCGYISERMTDDEYYEKFQKDCPHYKQRIPKFDVRFSFERIDPFYEYEE